MCVWGLEEFIHGRSLFLFNATIASAVISLSLSLSLSLCLSLSLSLSLSLLLSLVHVPLSFLFSLFASPELPQSPIWGSSSSSRCAGTGEIGGGGGGKRCAGAVF
jgi:hypothetical protein